MLFPFPLETWISDTHIVCHFDFSFITETKKIDERGEFGWKDKSLQRIIEIAKNLPWYDHYKSMKIYKLVISTIPVFSMLKISSRVSREIL